MTRSMTKDEFVEFAAFVYGQKWQTPLADELGTERRALVRKVASDEPIDDQTAGIILDLVDRKIEQVQHEYRALLDRIERLKREFDLDPTQRFRRPNEREFAS